MCAIILLVLLATMVAIIWRNSIAYRDELKRRGDDGCNLPLLHPRIHYGANAWFWLNYRSDGPSSAHRRLMLLLLLAGCGLPQLALLSFCMA